MQKLTSSIPLSLYVHLPWCVRKCPYCDFNSHQAPHSLPEELYVKALIKDFDEQLEFLGDRPIQSIFFGGGTPSLFSASSIAKILEAINKRIAFIPKIEITLEANPGTLDESRFLSFRQVGINRLSIGVQSLQDDKLKALGRIHNRDYALRAVEVAKKVGFDNFNMDLMHGLPNQTLQDAMSDLKDAIACNPTHLSWYQLTIEPNTLFHHRPPLLPPEEILWDIQEEGKALLAIHGYLQYEVSAYSKSNLHCKHNLNYWEFGDYIGIGAGAHSKLTNFSEQKIYRHWQVKNPRDYLDPQKSFTLEKKCIQENDLIFEFMLNALRLNKGVPFKLFLERVGLEKHLVDSVLKDAVKKGLLIDDPNILCATALGQRFLNNLVEMFLPET